jgi:hypothetical protein
MSVYVDPLMTCLKSRAWRWPKSCHMFADTVEELHAFAKRIGLRREWFQLTHGTFAHYDLNECRRIVAVRFGARELDRRAAVAKWIELGLIKRSLGDLMRAAELD